MLAVVLVGLFRTAGAGAREVVGGVTGNGDSALVKVGLSEGIGQWGIEAKWHPEVETTWFGVWGTLNTPEVPLLPKGSLPPFWKGLEAQGFIGVHILTDQSFDRILTMPTVGVLVAPLETMSFVGEVGYPMGRAAAQGETGWDLNSVVFLFGLEIRFPLK